MDFARNKPLELNMKKITYILIVLFAGILSSASLMDAYGQTDKTPGEITDKPISDATATIPDPQSSLDIIALAQKAKVSLNSKAKTEIKKELLQVLASDVSMQMKNLAAIRLAEVMIYGTGNLQVPESLLAEAKQLIKDDQYPLKAEVEYLFGVIDYIRSQERTRTLDNQRQEYFKNKSGSKNDQDPFLESAIEHFDSASNFPACDAVYQARIALEALSNPQSFSGYTFFLEMGKLFDDNSRLNTFAVGKQFYRVIDSYENGEVKTIIENKQKEEKETLGIFNGLSLAYFTTGKFQKALEINELALNQYGVTENTAAMKFNRASIFQYISKPNDAENEYKEVIEKFPVDDALRNRAIRSTVDILVSQNKRENAKEFLHDLIQNKSYQSNKDFAQTLLDKIK
jgi:hypothetical protein